MENNMEKKRLPLKYYFTAVERVKLSDELSQKVLYVDEVEADAKAVASEYKSKVNVLRSDVAKIAGQMKDGWETRDIECEVYYHQPEKGMKTIIRTDTKTSTTERMESYEWNLFTQPAQQDNRTEDADFNVVAFLPDVDPNQ